MYDPSMRVLTVLELLQEHEEITGQELARHLEVSARTVQRYVARLQDLGVPVEGRRGVGGAYRLRPGYRLPPLMFTAQEATSVALGLQALHLLGLDSLTPATTGARSKLRRALPAALREQVQALEQAVARSAPSPAHGGKTAKGAKSAKGGKASAHGKGKSSGKAAGSTGKSSGKTTTKAKKKPA